MQQRSGAAKAVDVAWLGEYLLGRWAKERKASRALAERAQFQFVAGLSVSEHRQRVFGQLHGLVAAGAVHRAFPKRFGGEDNHGGNIASFEELVLADPSLQIKSGVQWGLFAAAILHLGTAEQHERFLPDAMSLAVPGVFAMTETGHGSDVASLATTAQYEPESQEWVIHTPHRLAWKDYLGNAALHGQAAVVFARLLTQNVDYGVHAFYVPIRSVQGDFLPGVGGEDDGPKGGLNGVDNGRLHFDRVRIPRENLLARYGSVDAKGEYTSPIAKPSRRFFIMLGTLVQGRVSLDGSATQAAKLALHIAITYANQRRQFGTVNGEETLLLDYGRHQRRLLPRLAQSYALSFAHEEFLELFDQVFSGESDTKENRERVETVAAALKPLSTWAALEIIQQAREACGGAGFLAENRLTQLHADLDVYTTFEGDNNVLLQLAGKRLLGDYARRMHHLSKPALLREALAHGGRAAFGKTGLVSLGQNLKDIAHTSDGTKPLLGEDVQWQLLSERVERGISELAVKLAPGARLSLAEAAKLTNRHQNELILLARSYGQLLQWEAFTRAITKVPDFDTREALTCLRDLFGLWLIEKDASWYLIRGRVSALRIRLVTDHIDGVLLPRIREVALALVQAFGFTPTLVRTPLVSDTVHDADTRSDTPNHNI